MFYLTEWLLLYYICALLFKFINWLHARLPIFWYTVTLNNFWSFQYYIKLFIVDLFIYFNWIVRLNFLRQIQNFLLHFLRVHIVLRLIFLTWRVVKLVRSTNFSYNTLGLLILFYQKSICDSRGVIWIFTILLTLIAFVRKLF